MVESFARVETKYMLDAAQTEIIGRALTAHGFRKSDFGNPLVQSLYYDTPDKSLIRESLERPVYKEKLRLRAYGMPNLKSNTFVEIKKKYGGVVYKRRIALPLEAAARGLKQGFRDDEAGQVGQEARWMIERYGLIPSAVIAYERDAWFSDTDPIVRITFDRNIAYRMWNLDLRLATQNMPLTRPDQRLLEVKTSGTYPLWLSHLLWETGVARTHFSKYGSAYLQDQKEKLWTDIRRKAVC